jgi:hypothetical protein
VRSRIEGLSRRELAAAAAAAAAATAAALGITAVARGVELTEDSGEL